MKQNSREATQRRLAETVKAARRRRPPRTTALIDAELAASTSTAESWIGARRKEVAATRPTPKQQAGDESLDESSDSDIEYDPERETALLILRESIAYRVQRRRFEKQVLREEEEEQAWRLNDGDTNSDIVHNTSETEEDSAAPEQRASVNKLMTAAHPRRTTASPHQRPTSSRYRFTAFEEKLFLFVILELCPAKPRGVTVYRDEAFKRYLHCASFLNVNALRLHYKHLSKKPHLKYICDVIDECVSQGRQATFAEKRSLHAHLVEIATNKSFNMDNLPYKQP